MTISYHLIIFFVRRAQQIGIRFSSLQILKQMQMEISDKMTIRPHDPYAFVLANGDSSMATNSSRAHLPEEHMLTIPRLMINRDLCGSVH